MNVRAGGRPAGAVIVCDLGFGDAGKGLCTDWLVRRLDARWVIRWNGGAQAGHNVVLEDGRHHTFAQLGAGTFQPGVRTFLGPEVVLHPTALVVEVERLARIGVPDALARLHASRSCRVVTPYHQALNRLRELARGAARHGSVGVGVGEVVRDDVAHPQETLRAGDLLDRASVVARLRRVRERKRAERDALPLDPGDPLAAAEHALLDDPAIGDRFAQQAREVASRITLADDGAAPWLGSGAVVLEGAQGVLLDQWHGFHPHTTWSDCTFSSALALLERAGFAGPIVRLGVLRAFAVRHGAGPLPTEDPALGALLVEAHNGHGPWQGSFRVGWPDFVLARYALGATGGADALALTHLECLDRLAAAGGPRAAHGYRASDAILALFDTDDAGAATTILPSPAHDASLVLSRQEALGRALLDVTPLYRELPVAPEGAIAAFESALGLPVALASLGPRASDVRERPAAPWRG